MLPMSFVLWLLCQHINNKEMKWIIIQFLIINVLK